MRESRGRRIAIHVVLILVSAVMVIPFLWMVITALKTFTEATAVPPQLLPKVAQWQNFPDVFKQSDFPTLYQNSFISTAIRVAGQVFFSAMAGYAFAKVPFPGRKVLFPILMTVMMVPGLLYIIPQYLLVTGFGWVNTMQGLVITGLVSAFGTFLMRQFFKTLPDELIEAARLDGAGVFRTFFFVMLPLAKSGMVALTIFVALWSWNDLMWPLVVLNSTSLRTLPLGLATMVGANFTDIPGQMAGAAMAVVPMLVLFIILQRKFIEGLAFTASKQ